MSNSNENCNAPVTLHEIASAGLSKAVRAKRSRLEDCSALPGLPAPKRRSAPACGGKGAVADYHGDAPSGPVAGHDSDDEGARATDSVADVNAADWIAEDESAIFEDYDLEFEWEDGSNDDGTDGLVRISFSLECRIQTVVSVTA